MLMPSPSSLQHASPLQYPGILWTQMNLYSMGGSTTPCQMSAQTHDAKRSPPCTWTWFRTTGWSLGSNLTWPAPLNQGCCATYVLWKFPRNVAVLLNRSLDLIFRAPYSDGRGIQPKLRDLPGWVPISLPNFKLNGQGTMTPEASLALGPARHLGDLTHSTILGVFFNFCFVKFSQEKHRSDCTGPRTLFLGSPDTWDKGSQLQRKHWPSWVVPDLPAKFQPRWPRDHACRSPPFTWTSWQTPRRALGPDLIWAAATKFGTFFNFCFIKFSQKCTLWALWIPGPSFGGPWPLGWGVQPQHMRWPLIFQGWMRSRMPNFSPGCQMVWPPIPDEHSCMHALSHSRTHTDKSSVLKCTHCWINTAACG